jgi:hypothetical protein
MNLENSDDPKVAEPSFDELIETLAEILMRMREALDEIHEANEKALKEVETFGFVSE